MTSDRGKYEVSWKFDGALADAAFLFCVDKGIMIPTGPDLSIAFDGLAAVSKTWP